MDRPDRLAAASPARSVDEDSTELCAACGEANDAAAAECRSCGASLVLQLAPTSRGERRRPSSDSFWSAEGAPPPEAALDYAPGEDFAARYTIIDRLGQGGMGVVYKARDRELNRTVALKMIRGDLERDPEALERFRREPGLAQQVTHENVCRVHDLGVHDSVRFLSMEYLDADTLAALLGKLGSLSIRQTLEIGVQICEALEAIHSRGIIHRDLKPSNIAVDREQRVVVMDFGLARGPIDSEVTQPGVLVGSYAYLAPEHIRGEPLTAAADVYALGLVLYEMLTGRRPPGDEDMRPLALRGEHVACPPPSTHEPDVPPPLDDVVMRCLGWSSEERPSVAAIREALEAALASEKARVSPRRRRAPRSAHRTRALATVAGAALAAAALAIWLSSPPAVVPDARGGLAVVDFDVDVASPSYLSPLAGDALTASLRAVPGLEVKTVEPELAQEPSPRIAASLGTAWVLRGQARTESGRTSFTPRLENAEGAVVWTANFEGEDPLEALEASRLELLSHFGVEAKATEPLTRLRTASLAAYRRFLEARKLHDGWYASEGFDAPRALYQQSIELDPEFAAAHAGQAVASLGQYLKSEQESDLAVARYESRRAVALGTKLPESHIAAGTVLLGEKRWEEAAAALRRGLELAPGDDALLRNLADLYDTLGRKDEAKSLYEEAVAAAPEHWTNYYWYGRFLYRSGDLEAAPAHLARAVELNPSARGPVTLLGFHALSSGDLHGARSRFARALELSDDADARQRLGLVAYYEAEYGEALAHWSVVLEAEPERPSAHANVADALRQLGRAGEADTRYREALALYDSALERAPNDPDLLAQRAQVLAAEGKCQQARQGVQWVLDAHPETTDFLVYGAVVAGRCAMEEWAVALVLRAIGSGNVAGVGLDPDLETVRSDGRVSRALSLIGFPTS